MGLSRQEVNLRRLLAKCELLCKNNKDDERLFKYVETLEDMFHDVKKLTDPNSEFLPIYQRRISAIKAQLGITTNKYEDDYRNADENLRRELLGVRNRNLQTAELNDLDQVINYHENLQQKITDDMLSLTRNLKEQSELANQIIRKDTEVVARSTQLTDRNYSKLGVESSKLTEHSKRAWKCWMWIMLLIVMVVFINMVLFMKVVKKNV